MNSYDKALAEFFAKGGVVTELPYKGTEDREVGTHSNALRFRMKPEEKLSSDDLTD